jgi:hypothetical protein
LNKELSVGGTKIKIMKELLIKSTNFFDTLFSTENVRKVELNILRFSVFSFLIHLTMIFLGNNFLFFENFQHSYLKAIYTPFSFILFYEVFLLVIIIPKSISEFVGKQFEIITLITLRSFFHDIADIDLKKSFELFDDHFIYLMYDLGTSLFMLGFTILYYKIYNNTHRLAVTKEINNFISIKKMVALIMTIVLLALSFSSLYHWGIDSISALTTGQQQPNPNAVFYNDFFSVMIFVDVFLLLISFIYHFSFYLIFRNASFIITTILIRMSLTMQKPTNYIIILIAFIFAISSFYLYSLQKEKEN